MDPQTYSRVRASLDTLATVLVIVAALACIALAGAAWQRGQATSSPAKADARNVPRSPHPLDGAPLLGNPKAPLAIIEYADFECPACADFVRDAWPKLKAEYVDAGKVLVSFRHLPLKNHLNARPAAIGAECAARQEKFWAMHDLLFIKQGAWDDSFWQGVPHALALDRRAFEICSQSAGDKIDADRQLASMFGISGTPSFLIGRVQANNAVTIERVLVGSQPFPIFSAVLEQLLRATDVTNN